MGEGGGQVLRTSLGLSLVTGQPFRIEKIRAGREKPGLMRQHLTAVRAAAAVGGAKLSGDEIGSRTLVFEPGPVRPGEYEFAVGTAGSTTLVLQTILPAMIVASGPSRLVLKGGTHNPWSPPFDFLKKAFLPLLARMGAAVTVELVRPGFYPAGGGEFTVEIQPAPGGRLRPLELLDRGEPVSRHATAIVAKLPDHIAERELKVVQKKLGWSGTAALGCGPQTSLTVQRADESAGPGNIVLLEIASQHVTEVFTGFGELAVRAEAVAHKAVDEARAYLAAGVPVGQHLADQLLIPLALSAVEGGGGKFRTLPPTRHTTTNIDVIQKFMDVTVSITRPDPDRGVWEIEMKEVER
jgi:RNA 3'-terminal phosphate cyclase (ATP)